MAYLIRACQISYMSHHDIPNALTSVLPVKYSTSKNKANRSLCIVHGIDHHLHKPLAKKKVELHRIKHTELHPFNFIEMFCYQNRRVTSLLDPLM